MCKCLYLFVLTFCFLHAYAQANDSVFTPATLSAIVLSNADNREAFHIDVSPDKPLLFIFLSPDCPLCKNYSATLNALYQRYSNNVRFYGIIPGKTYTTGVLQVFKSAYQINFPLLIDSNKLLSNYLQVTTTPEVIFLNPNATLAYKGAIDNWMLSLGKQRAKPTQNYLQDALERNMQHTMPAVKRTKAVGCKINDF